MQVFNVNSIKHRHLSSKNTKEKLSLSAVLTELMHFKDIFVHHEVLAPGKRASLPHIHTSREEMVYVLIGNPTLEQEGEVVELKAGDFIGFAPNQKPLHVFSNKTKTNAELLVIASNPTDDQVLFD